MTSSTFVSELSRTVPKEQALILWFEEVGIADIPFVGGKNASLGEMIRQLQPKGVVNTHFGAIPLFCKSKCYLF